MTSTIRQSFVFLLLLLSIQFTSGCGGGDGSSPTPPNNSLTATDKQLAGQWFAEKINTNGDRVVLTIKPGSGERQLNITAVRPGGSTFNVTDGTYSIDAGQLHFNFSTLSSVTVPFSLDANATTLTLGTEPYHRLTADGIQVGGQVQITQAAANESVAVNSITTSEILVKYKDGRFERRVVAPDDRDVQALSVQGESLEGTGGVAALAFRQLDLHDLSVQSASEQLKKLNQDPDVVYAVPNHLLKIQSLANPTDTLFNEQWNLELLDMTDAWGKSTATKDVVVAVIDTGIVRGHPDLPASRVLFDDGYDFVHQKMDGVPNLSLDGDGPDNDPTDPGDHRNLGLPGGSSWHGTHIAGIIAAMIDNGLGTAGIARQAKILPLRAIGFGGNGALDDVAQAIYYAAKLPNIAECSPFTILENGGYSFNRSTWACHINPNRPKADVINLSLGEALTAFDASPLTEAVDAASAAGVTIVASAGNEHMGPGFCLNANGIGYHADATCNFYPAADSNVLSVGAVLPNLSFAENYSNHGPTQFLVAPGGGGNSGILSTVHPSVNGGYGELVGTSQAAAHVSAVAAMVISEIRTKRPDLAPADLTAQVKEALRSSAIDMGVAGRDDLFGWGLVNPCGALLKAQEVSASGTPALYLSSQSVDFGILGASDTVLVTSGCGAPAVTGLSTTKTTRDGKDWISLTFNSFSTPAQLIIRVNRSGLTTGDYSGSVMLSSPAGSQTIRVAMKVSPTSVPNSTGDDALQQNIDDLLSKSHDSGSKDDSTGGSSDGPNFANTVDIGEVHLLLVDSATGETKAHTTTDLSANYHFQFLGVAPGSYYLVWGVDENGNNKICSADDKDEPCRVYPNPASPQVIQMTSSTKMNNLALIF